MNFVGIKYEYDAFILLKVGEFSPTETNCSLPKVNLFPEVGFTELFKLFLVALAIIPVSYTHLTLPTTNSV